MKLKVVRESVLCQSIWAGELTPYIGKFDFFFLIFFLAVPQSSFAADFGVLDFGGSCDAVIETEAATGSKFESEEKTGREISAYVFSGLYEGIPTKVVYQCYKGNFVEGGFMFDSASLNESSEMHATVKRALTKKYGDPTFDGSSLNRQRAEDVAANLELRPEHNFSCAWRSERILIVIALVPDPARDTMWQLGISIRPSSAFEQMPAERLKRHLAK